MARKTRLQDSSKRQVQVRDLARELSVENRVLIKFLLSIGEYVKSAASNVEPPVARRVREEFPQTVSRTCDADPAAVAVLPDMPGVGLTPPAPRQRRENNPYVTQTARARDNVPYRRPWLDDYHRREAAADDYTNQSEDPTAGFAAAIGQRPSPTFEFLEWQVRRISEPERDVWISHGLKPHHASVAAECREAGIGPTHLSVILDGWTILYRVTHGEGAASLARRLRRSSA